MDDYMGIGLKLKRKGVDYVSEDFSEFSLSSPARKIRRLDAGLPPIIEEEEREFPLGYEPQMAEGSAPNGVCDQVKPWESEDFPVVPENEEKAIVLFKPMANPLFQAANGFSVDPNLISSFKNQALLGAHLNTCRRTADEDAAIKDGGDRGANACRAVIPWVPSQPLDSTAFASQADMSDSMDAEEMDASAMEVEDASPSNFGPVNGDHIDHHRVSEGLQQQWQQQHCMVPQPPQNTTTPIVWYR